MRRIHWWSGAIGAAVLASAAFAAPTATAAGHKPNNSHSVSHVAYGKVTSKGRSGGGDKGQGDKGKGDAGKANGKGKGSDGRQTGGKGRDDGGKGRDDGGKGRDDGGKGGHDRGHGGKPKPPPRPPWCPPYPPPCLPDVKLDVRHGNSGSIVHGEVRVNSAAYQKAVAGLYVSDNRYNGFHLADRVLTDSHGQFQAEIASRGHKTWFRAVVASQNGLGSQLTPPQLLQD